MSNEENFALANPIRAISDKSPEMLTREDLVKIVAAKQIERITFHYTAIDGKIKELKIPIASMRQLESILGDGERCDGSSLFKGLIDAGQSDLYIVPDYKTAFLNPFESGSLDFFCRFLTPDGNLASFSPDNILHKAHNLLKKNSGLELHALGEMEFFLLSPNDGNLFPIQRQKAYHATAPFAKSGAILNEMIRLLTQVTGVVKYAHYEVGCQDQIISEFPEVNGKRAEQLEIELLPAAIETAADNIILARWIIRNIAYKYGMSATFAPKLDDGLAGNGMHIHMALMKNGKNIMAGNNGNLTDEALKVIGGLCTYADTLTAFGNTVSSSYLRLVPNQEAPTNVCWSDMNRSALIRVPLGWTKVNNLAQRINPQQIVPFNENWGRQTVELRSPDGSANAHLLLAGITMAAEWGLTNGDSLEIAKSHYVKGNIHEDKDRLSKLQSLPTSCAESSKALLGRRSLYEREGVFPTQIITFCENALKLENDENLNKRLHDSPPTERLNESKRIMHKDLHKH